MPMKSAETLSWIVDKFENGSAVLKNKGQKLVIPRSQLAKTIREGDVVTAEFFLLKDEQARKDNLAKALLEEILGKE